jgi:tetratricopeptide (TPR) repeat protein
MTAFAWHVHHNILVEPLIEPIEVRVAYIREYKPHEEVELRLKLLKVVQGELPAAYVRAWEAYDRAREAYIEAREACDRAWEAYVKARAAYDRVSEACVKAREAYDRVSEAYDRAWEACVKASEAYIKAWEAYDRAWEAYDRAREACQPEIEALHALECPGCPWDGRTIFPQRHERRGG